MFLTRQPESNQKFKKATRETEFFHVYSQYIHQHGVVNTNLNSTLLRDLFFDAHVCCVTVTISTFGGSVAGERGCATGWSWEIVNVNCKCSKFQWVYLSSQDSAVSHESCVRADIASYN